MCVPSLKACEPTETELGFTTLPEEPELLRGNTQHASLSAVCHVLWGKKKSHLHSRPRQVSSLHETKS